MSWWNPVSWFGGGGSDSGGSKNKESSGSSSGGSPPQSKVSNYPKSSFNPGGYSKPPKSKVSNYPKSSFNPGGYSGGSSSSSGSSNRNYGGGGSSSYSNPIIHHPLKSSPIKLTPIIHHPLKSTPIIHNPIKISPLRFGENLISSGERFIKKEYNSGYLNPLQPKKFLNVFATPNSKKVIGRYQPAHIGLNNNPSFNYPVRTPAPSIRRGIINAFKNEQTFSIPSGYQTQAQHSFSGNPLKEVGSFLTNIFSSTKNLVPRKGDYTYINKKGELTNKTVAQNYQIQIKNNPILQTTEGKLIGLQVQKTSKRIANDLKNTLLPIYQKRAQEDFSKTQSLINNANNVSVENSLIKKYQIRMKKRNQEYSSNFQRQYKNKFKNKIKGDLSSNKNIQINQEFWKKYNSSLKPVVNLPKILSSLTEAGGAIVSSPIAVGLGGLGAFSGGHKTIQGIQTGNIKKIGSGLLETALSSLMIKGGLSSIRSSAISKNIDSLLNPNVKYSNVHLFSTDKPDIYLLVKETPIRASNGNSFEKTLLYVEKKGNSDFSVVGGMSKLEGNVGVGSKIIHFGNQNLIRGISTKGEINAGFPLKNLEGLKVSKGNIKISFSKGESTPISKQLIERNFRGKRGKFSMEEYNKGIRGSLKGKFKVKKNSLFIRGKPKLRKTENFFKEQPLSFSLNSPKVSISGYMSGRGGYRGISNLFPKNSRPLLFEPRLPKFKSNEISFLKNQEENNPSYYIKGSSEKGILPKSSFNNEEIKKELKIFSQKKSTSKVTSKDLKFVNKIIGKNYKIGQEMNGVTKGELLKELKSFGVGVPTSFKSLLKSPSNIPNVGLFAPSRNYPQVNKQVIFGTPKFQSPFQFQSSFNLKNFNPKTQPLIEIPRNLFGGGNRGIERQIFKPIRKIQIPKNIQKKKQITIQTPKSSQRNSQFSLLGNLQFENLFGRSLLLQNNRVAQRTKTLQRTRTIQRSKISPRQRVSERSFSLVPIHSSFNFKAPKVNPSFIFGGKSLGSSLKRKVFKNKGKVIQKTGYQASVGAVLLGLKTTKRRAKEIIKHYEGARLRPEISSQVPLINRNEFNRMHPAFVKASPVIIDRLISEGNNLNKIIKLFTIYNTKILQNEQKILLERKYLTVSQKVKKLKDLKNQEKRFNNFSKEVIKRHFMRRRNERRTISKSSRLSKTNKPFMRRRNERRTISKSPKLSKTNVHPFRQFIPSVSRFLINNRQKRMRKLR